MNAIEIIENKLHNNIVSIDKDETIIVYEELHNLTNKLRERTDLIYSLRRSLNDLILKIDHEM